MSNLARPNGPPGKGGLGDLVKDKRFLIAAGAVGFISIVVLARRSGSSQAPGIGGGSVPVGSAGYVQGGADTTGTDIASFLSNYSAGLNNQLADWTTTLTSTLDAIKNGPDAPSSEDPSVIWTKDPSGKPTWAVLNSPYGGYMTTSSQTDANAWAAQYEEDKTANFVDWATFQNQTKPKS